MAGEVPNQEAKQENWGKSLRSIMLGSSIILWVLAVFMISALNGINDKLGKMEKYLVTTMSMAARTLESYQVVDPEGEIVYSFRAVQGLNTGGPGGGPMPPPGVIPGPPGSPPPAPNP